MVEFSLRIHPAQRQLYTPKEIVNAFGLRLKARPNRYAMIVYPEGVDLAFVLKSLMLIAEDIKLELKTRGDEKASGGVCERIEEDTFDMPSIERGI